MAGMSRDSATVELGAEPEFNYGDKVRSRKHVKNDGTFTGAEIGEVIVTKGDIGFIISIGTYLQQFYIYGVDFYERGHLVGMKGRELDLIESNLVQEEKIP